MSLTVLQDELGVSIQPGTAAFLERSHGLLIDGEVKAAKDGATLEIYDPGTGRLLTQVASGGSPDVDQAVRAAVAAQVAWADTAPQDRERLLHRLAELVEIQSQELAELEVLDTGKPLHNAAREIKLAAACFRYYAGWPTKLYGETNPTSSRVFSYTVRQPVGVCGLITAWNYPFLLASWKVAPALAFGNAFVLKPASQTPLSSLRLGELCLEAGIPNGVANVVPGLGNTAGNALVEHPGVAKLAFTGSTPVGKSIAASAAQSMKRLTLELGGKSPNIVFADADLEDAAAGAIRGIFWNAGQLCVAGSRLLAERSVAEQLVAAIVERTRLMKVGHGLEPGVDMGPLISDQHRQRVYAYVERGLREGATLVLGGSIPDSPGYFMDPTILTDVNNGMQIARDEVFGPVLAVIPFDGVEEAVQLANDTDYGLAAAVWTRDVARAHDVAHRLNVGTVWVNTFGVLDPSTSFGGFKESGIGRELGPHSVDAYTEVKSVYVGMK